MVNLHTLYRSPIAEYSSLFHSQIEWHAHVQHQASTILFDHSRPFECVIQDQVIILCALKCHHQARGLLACHAHRMQQAQ